MHCASQGFASATTTNGASAHAPCRSGACAGWLLLVLALVASLAPAWASGALSFEGGGYWVELEVGDAPDPVVARVRVHRPGDARGTLLPAGAFQVDAFDPGRRVLVLRHAGARAAAAAPAFVLRVHQDEAVLDIDGRRIVAGFDWSM